MSLEQERHWRNKASRAKACGCEQAIVDKYISNADALCEDQARLGTLGVLKLGWVSPLQLRDLAAEVDALKAEIAVLKKAGTL